MANRFFTPNQQFLANPVTGAPLAGGLLYFYLSGTSTPHNTYADSALATPNANPVVLDSNGYAGSIFLDEVAYKVVLTDSNNVQIWTEDPVWSSDFSTYAQLQVVSGNPNGQLAGVAGTVGTLPGSSTAWDFVNNILYVATTTGTSTTTVWTAVNGTAPISSVVPPCGRLTLTSGVPVTTSDVTAATAVIYTPYVGNTVPIFNSTAFTNNVFTELTLNLVAAHAASTNYDVFIFNNSGVLTLVTGPAWSSRTSRGTGAGTTQISFNSGILVNAVIITGRNGSSTYTIAANLATYIGTFGTTGTNGQTEDSVLNRLVWNYYSRRTRAMSRVESTASWTYSTNTFRQTNASTSNQLTYVYGVNEDQTYFLAQSYVASTAGSTFASAGIGIDSTTVDSSIVTVPFDEPAGGGIDGIATATYIGFPGLGFHTIAWLEVGAGSGTQTWSGTAAHIKTGITGTVTA